MKDETYYIQLSSGLTNFRSISIKPYFRSKNTNNVKPDELEAPAELDKLEALAKLDKLEALIPTLLVYGAYLRISNLDPPTPSIIE